MSHTGRLLWGAPGALLAGFPARDDDRALLVDACQRITEHWVSPFLDDLLHELRTLWPEVQRMREEMGPERMAKDARQVDLQRAAAVAAWLLQRETAWLQAFFAPGDPEAESFRPALALALNASSYQKRITRLDSLRQAYRVHPEIPDAGSRAEALGTASSRLFRALTEAREGAVEPVPLGEARQRLDRAYATLRDVVVARRNLPPETLTALFPDLSPAWRLARLQAA